MAPSLVRCHQRQLFVTKPRRTYDRIHLLSWPDSHILTHLIAINKTAPATGSQLVGLSQIFPLGYAPEPFSCHFELSRKAQVGQGPPYALGKDFYVAIDNDAKPVTWSQGTVNASATSTASSASKSAESTASPTPTPQASGSSSGLSQGAKIGIGVGVALGVLALIAAAAAFFWLRRRRNARMAATDNTYGAHGSQLPNEKYGSSKIIRSEMPADSQVHEKDSAPVAMNTIGELEAPRY